MCLREFDRQINQPAGQSFGIQGARRHQKRGKHPIESFRVLGSQRLGEAGLTREKLIQRSNGRPGAVRNRAHGGGFVTDFGNYRLRGFEQLRHTPFPTLLLRNFGLNSRI